MGLAWRDFSRADALFLAGRHGNSRDGSASGAQSRERISRVPADNQHLHSVVPEERASLNSPPSKTSRFCTSCRDGAQAVLRTYKNLLGLKSCHRSDLALENCCQPT